MTGLEALKELAAKVEAGTATHGCFASAFINDDPDDPGCVNVAVQSHHAFNGSLDAAKALHEAVLPGWFADTIRQTNEGWAVWIIRQHDYSLVTGGRSNTPARAWLLAIIRALIAQEEAQ